MKWYTKLYLQTLKLSYKKATGKNQSSWWKPKKVKKEQKEQAEVGQEDTKEDVTAENGTKRRVHPVVKQKQKKPGLMMNILFQILSVVSILPLLFSCLVKACFLDTLKIITIFFYLFR